MLKHLVNVLFFAFFAIMPRSDFSLAFAASVLFHHLVVSNRTSIYANQNYFYSTRLNYIASCIIKM